MSIQTMNHTILRAEGFACPSCVRRIEKQVALLDGVEAVKVHFTSSRVEVVHDADKAPVDALVGAVAAAGYRSTPTAF